MAGTITLLDSWLRYTFTSDTITLSGNGDVLVVVCARDTATQPTFNLTNGGSVDEDLTEALFFSDSSRTVAFYTLDISEIPAGTYTLSHTYTAIGAAAYECTGYTTTVEATDSGYYIESPLTEHTSSITTTTNNAAIFCAMSVHTAVATTGVTGAIDTHLNLQASGDCGGVGYTTDAGTLGSTSYGLQFAGTNNYFAYGAIALTASGEIPPVDIDLTFSGVETGTEVRIYERAHAAIWTFDTAGLTDATAEETTVTWNAWYSSNQVSHKLWIDLDNGSTNPLTETAWAGSTAYSVDDVRQNGSDVYVCTTAGTSAASGGPTGYGTGITDGTAVWSHSFRIHEADIVTGDDDSDIATDGQISIPTTDAAAAIDVTQIGSADDGTTAVDGIESTSGDWVATITVGSPRQVMIHMMHIDYKFIRFAYLVGRADASIPAGALQVEDLVYDNPA